MKGITPFFILLILGLVALISTSQLEQVIGLLTGENARLDLTAKKMRDQIQNEAFVNFPGNYYTLLGPCSGTIYIAEDGWEVPEEIRDKIKEQCFGAQGIVCVMIPRYTTALSGCAVLANIKPDRTYFPAPTGFMKTTQIEITEDYAVLRDY